MSLTVGEHDNMLRRQDEAMVTMKKCLPSIANTLKFAEIRNLNKELYDVGAITKEEYVDNLKQIAEQYGIKFNFVS